MLLALGKALGQQEASRDDFIGQMLSHDVSREKLPNLRADKEVWREENETICLHSTNVKRIGEEDATKSKELTITSSEKRTKNKENNQEKLHVSLILAGRRQ